jgi:hypothetical protein
LGLETGLYWMQGDVGPESPLFGGIADPSEVALDLRVRGYIVQALGLNLFCGFRVGHLMWDYVNPVYAEDSWGWGDELWNDSLNSFTGYWGIGVTPFRTRVMHLGVDVGAGWRDYARETTEGFQNDVFRGGWSPQVSVEVALRF